MATIAHLQSDQNLALEQLIDTAVIVFVELVTTHARRLVAKRTSQAHARSSAVDEEKEEQEALELLRTGFKSRVESLVEDRPCFGLALAAIRLLSALLCLHVLINTRNNQPSFSKAQRVFNAIFRPLSWADVPNRNSGGGAGNNPSSGEEDSEREGSGVDHDTPNPHNPNSHHSHSNSYIILRGLSELQAFLLLELTKELSRVGTTAYLHAKPSVLVTLAALFQAWTNMDLRSTHLIRSTYHYYNPVITRITLITRITQVTPPRRPERGAPVHAEDSLAVSGEWGL